MTTEDQTPVLVLKDQTGDFFLLPQEVLERGRVPAEHRAEVERLITEAGGARAGEGDDTQGYVFWLTWWLPVDIALVIGFTGPRVETGSVPAPSTGGGPAPRDNVGNKI